MSIAIEFKNVHKFFRDGKDHVLKGINLAFQKGELTYILGSSGAGKSVMLKHILGLIHPDQGEVWVEGKNLATLSREELSQHRLLYGMLFQNSALFDDMTVFENVAFPLYEHTKLKEPQIQAMVQKVLDQLKIPQVHYDKFPNELSGGMRKRVGLARAIIREPQVLLYDEPTTGLDPVTRTTVDDLIDQLKNDLHLTSIVISHDIPSALLLADHIAFLHQGQIVFWGTPHEFRNSKHEAILSFLQAEERTVQALQKGHA